MPGTNFEDAKEGEVEVGELEREEFGGEAGTEEGSVGPRGRQAMGVVGVEVSKEVCFASLSPTVHRYQPILHFLNPLSLTHLSSHTQDSLHASFMPSSREPLQILNHFCFGGQFEIGHIGFLFAPLGK